jgi:hypothetical protein
MKMRMKENGMEWKWVMGECANEQSESTEGGREGHVCAPIMHRGQHGWVPRIQLPTHTAFIRFQTHY